jgi:hypothetical protein
MRQYREILTALLEKNGSATKKTLSYQCLDNHPFWAKSKIFRDREARVRREREMA